MRSAFLWLGVALGLGACGAGERPTAQADAAAVERDAQVTTPDAEALTPDAQVTTPDAEALTPDAEVITPDAQVTTPDAEALTPDAEAVTPDAEVITPDAQVTTPDAEAVTPDAEALPPDAEALPPDAAPLPPDAEALTPDAARRCVPFNTADASADAPTPDPDAGPPDAAPPATPVWPADRAGLAVELTLDGDFTDSAQGNAFVADRPGGFAPAARARGGANQAYGPTGAAMDNGAVAAGLTTLPTEGGLTLEGWFLKAGNNGSGRLFGFGTGAWGTPTLGVHMSWGELVVFSGAAADRQVSGYGRVEDCWHHVAVVLPPGFEAGAPWTVYVDGARVAPTRGAERASPRVFGAPFEVGRFTLPDGARMAVDEVRVWTRALTEAEVAAAAQPRGDGPGCRPGARAWEPGPRCTPELPMPAFRPTAEVRVLTDEWAAVYVDPTPALEAQYIAACGAYLGAMERNRDVVADWWADYQYAFAWQETRLAHLPALVDALDAPWAVVGCDGEAAPVAAQHPWLEALGESVLPRPWAPDLPPQRTLAADVGLVTYLRLPRALTPGETVALRDPWGFEHPLTFDLDTTRSWALKANQVAYVADAPKHAWLGGWVPVAGPLDTARFDGALFDVVEEATGRVAYSGVVTPTASLEAETGERLSVLDFSPLRGPGRYYVRVPGVGRSRSFDISEAALGEPFVTYARGLYHNRCAPLDAAYTAWARGDAHRTFVGGFPPFAPPESASPGNDYADHAADGWGLLDEAGAAAGLSGFEVVAATATDAPLPEVTGGWHDAGDFDRRSFHLRSVEDLAQTFLLNPTAFTDGQLNLPESGNGLPDLLDEAVFGLEVWRAAQTPEGGVGAWIEATSHPQITDPGVDDQPYYLALPTRNSALLYARTAAILSRALRLAGDAQAADGWAESAARAFDYASRDAPPLRHDFVDADGRRIHYVEPPGPAPGRTLWALTELWRATGDAAYGDALLAPAMQDVFEAELGSLWWRGQITLAASVAEAPEAFPQGWGEAARVAVAARAETWLEGQARLPYNRAWYPPDHPYFDLRGWGNDQYMPARELALAWRLLGDARYRDGALAHLDYQHGANPLGRVHVTGLGQHFAAVALHLPSYADAWDEPVPGVPLYGPSVGVPYSAWQSVYAVESDARADPSWPGARALLLPPSLAALAAQAPSLRDWLGQTIPPWRRFVALEQSNVPSMEFTVWETTAPAVQATGLLLEPGYRPPERVARPTPRDDAALRSSRWIMP